MSTKWAVLNESIGAIAVLSPCKGRVHCRLRGTVAQRMSGGDAIDSTTARAPWVLCARASSERQRKVDNYIRSAKKVT